jgi:hypothetical protein
MTQITRTHQCQQHIGIRIAMTTGIRPASFMPVVSPIEIQDEGCDILPGH